MADPLRMDAELPRDRDDRADGGLIADALHPGAAIEGARQLLERPKRQALAAVVSNA
jgi:hypothetical protein